MLKRTTQPPPVLPFADMTLCSLVTNPTFPTLVKLLDGGYGSRVLSPGHTVLAINPSWGTSKEIGQFWER